MSKSDVSHKPDEPRSKIEHGLDTAKDTAIKLVDATRGSARDTARKTAEGIEANPLSVLVGGVALGVLAGAFIPHSAQEKKLLGPIGKRLTDTASGAVEAAKDAGKAELDNLGLSRDAARDQAGKVFQGFLQAMTAAGTAAVSASGSRDEQK